MMHVRNPLYRSLRVFLIVALLSSVLAVVGPGAAADVSGVTIVTPNVNNKIYKQPGKTFTVTYDATGTGLATANFYLVNGGDPLIGTKSISLPVDDDTQLVTIAGGQAEGIYGLKVEVVATATEDDVELNTVYVDGTAPGVTIDSIPAWVDALNSITGTSSDTGAGASGVFTVTVSIQQASDSKYWDGTDWDSAVVVWNGGAANTGTAFSTWSYSPPTWSNGETYTVYARATDNAGNVTASPPYDTFTYDSTYPTVSITGPPGPLPGWENSVTPLVGPAADTGSGLVASSVEVQVYNLTGNRYWNGTIWTATASWDDAAWVPDSWTYTMPTLTSGRAYTVTARATDVAGNASLTPQYGFNYDDAEPTVAITTPDLLQNYYNAMPQFAGTAADATPGSGLDKVEVTLEKVGGGGTWWDGSTWVVTTTVPILLATGTDNWTYGSLSGAFQDTFTYEVSAKSTDIAGNDPGVSDQFTFDTTKPAVTIDIIAAEVGCDFAQISGTSSDATSGVITVTIKISDTTGNKWWEGSVWGDTPTWLEATGTTAWTFDLTAGVGVTLTDGSSYKVWASALDNAGNDTATPKTDTFTYDACPTVVLTLPADGANLKELDAITGTAGDGVGAVVEVKVQIRKGLTSEYWNGNDWQGTDAWVNAVDTSAGGTWDGWEYNTSGIAFPDEDYILRAKSKDDFGQWSEEDESSFTFDATAPSVTINNIPDPGKPTEFTGTASDGLSGVYAVTVKVGRVRGITTKYWDGNSWEDAASWLPASMWIGPYLPLWAWKYLVGDVFDANLKDDIYTVCARGTDKAGNTTAEVDWVCETFKYSLAAGPHHDITLGLGWNLISLPLIPYDTSIEVVMADQIAAGTVNWADSFFWESGALVEKKWDPPVILELTTMTTGQGYWVSMSGAASLGNVGSYLPAPPQVPSSYAVYAGWNMIGYHATTAATLLPSGAKSVNVYLGTALYADVQAMYYYEGGAYKAVLTGEQMKPGFGYWMALDAAGTIYP